MSTKDDGGPAFPYSALCPEGPMVYKDSEGMTLRDYFAAKAMAAMIGTVALPCMTGLACGLDDACAKAAYAMADAMLETRKS